MSQTEYTGYKGTWTWNSVSHDGVISVTIDESDGPDTEQLDVTVYGDSVYTYLPDPLGPKGDDKATVTVVLQASSSSYADNKNTKHAFNSAQSGVFDAAAAVTNANTYTNASLELTQRETKIPFNAYATCTLTFEANALGSWDSPA